MRCPSTEDGITLEQIQSAIETFDIKNQKKKMVLNEKTAEEIYSKIFPQITKLISSNDYLEKQYFHSYYGLNVEINNELKDGEIKYE